MSVDIIEFDKAEPLLDWLALTDALAAGHKMPRAEIGDTFLYRGDRPVAHSAAARMDAARKETDLVLVRRSGKVHVWVDGRLLLSVPAAGEAAPVGLAIYQGSATFEDVRVRRF